MVHQLLTKPSVSDKALPNALDGSLITLKLTRDQSVEQRCDYARWLMGPNVVNENKVMSLEKIFILGAIKEDRKKQSSSSQSM